MSIVMKETVMSIVMKKTTHSEFRALVVSEGHSSLFGDYPHSNFYGAFIDGKIASAVCLSFEQPADLNASLRHFLPKSATVVAFVDVVTAKEFLGKGIAKSLLTYVFNSTKGIHIFYCVEKSNSASIALIESLSGKIGRLITRLNTDDAKESEFRSRLWYMIHKY